jgi:hypothetical protein
LSRRAIVLLAAGLAALILGGLALWALPEVVRRVAVAKIPALTGRATSIGRVELNLFTGRFAVTNFSMARAPGRGPEPFVQFDRLAGRLSLRSLFSSEIRLVELRLSHPIVRITRTGPVRFDFADIVDRLAQPTPTAPSRWILSVGRLEIGDGQLLFTDADLSPPVEWRVDGLGVEVSDVATGGRRPPGRARLVAGVGPATLRVTSDALALAPLDASFDVALADFDLARIQPYLPADLPAFPETGVLALDLKVAHLAAGALDEGSASGEVRVERLAVAPRGQSTPFLSLDRFRVALKNGDLLGKRIAIDAIEADGVDVKIARDRNGQIDLLAAFAGPGASEPAPPVAPASTDAGRSPAPANASTESARAPPSPPEPRKITLDRLALKSGTVTFRDDGVSPGREWKLEDLTIDGAGFSTSPGDAPATARVRAQIGTGPAGVAPAAFSLDADSIRLTPPSATARVSLEHLGLATVEPYWPPTIPVVARAGSLGVVATVTAEQGDGALRRASVSGTVRGEGLSVVRRGDVKPFLTIPKLSVVLKQADAVARTAALGSIEIEGADLTVVRDALGRIGLIDLADVAQPAVDVVKSRTGLRGDELGAAPPPPAPAAGPEWRGGVDRFALTKGRFTFDDNKVSPHTSLVAPDVGVLIEHLSWPFTTPASFSFAVSMPGGGRTEAKGTAVLEPLNVHVSVATRDGPVEPYQAYFPFAARLRGLFSGDSQNEIQRGPAGELILASRGTAWARALEVWAPSAQAPVARMEEMQIRGIDFSWPNYALIDGVTLRKPEVQIERDTQGVINLQALFAVSKDEAARAPTDADRAQPPADKAPLTNAPAPTSADAAPTGNGAGLATTSRAPASPSPAPTGPGPPPTGSSPAPTSTGAPPTGAGAAPISTSPGSASAKEEGTVLDFKEIAIVDGYTRFIDRTTSPPFSQDVSRLNLTLRDLSNIFGRAAHTTLSAQALLGTDGALDLRGELSGIGEALRADLIVELRDYSLSTANPYAENLTSWVIQRGKLQAKIHYRIEGDRITAEHDLDFKGLRVSKSGANDQAQHKIGVPLGLAVALLKDSHGDIDFSIPLKGSLADRSFNWGDAMWEGVKQVITKVLLAPFHAIGRMFTGSEQSAEKLEVNPVTFASGSAVVAPEMETQLTHVADFLRRSPAIKLALSSVVSSSDAQSVKMQAVTARVQDFRRGHDLPDLDTALAAYYKEQLPGVAPPPTVDEQLVLLADREPSPAKPLADLAERRLAAARERLVTVEGIPAERLALPAAAPSAESPPAESGEGRVEFTIVDADE